MTSKRVERIKTVEGLTTPAFIVNGPTHVFTDLEVYADGLVNCWELVDLPLFEEKLARRSVTAAVPDGGELRVQGLGTWTIHRGVWAIDSATLLARVAALLRELNPRLENLWDCHGQTTAMIDGVSVGLLGTRRRSRSAAPATRCGRRRSAANSDRCSCARVRSCTSRACGRTPTASSSSATCRTPRCWI